MENKQEPKNYRYQRTNVNEKTDNYGFIVNAPIIKGSNLP